MATTDDDRRPKYQRIADSPHEAIQSGDYGPGDRLPGETEARKGAGVFVRDFRPIRRRSIDRLARDQWGSGRSVWAADIGERVLEVDRISVSEERVPERVGAVLDLADDAAVCVRRRRFVLDGKPVLLATSYLAMSLVAGSAITREDTGPGGTYARLAELGHEPVHFREEIRSRMPSKDEAAELRVSAGTPVILVCRTAYAAEGHAVEVNEMTLDAASYVLEYDFDAGR